ncbi:MAG TPA: site-2 protease family protein [Steroidobacteraceae bacterium]|nr:site-2 protease family protein [Steroidobacteraceae bacterium]
MLKTLLLLANAAKLGPILKTGGTMLISVGAYALVFGWWYAVGFVLLILVHELGHYVAARRIGLNAGLPTFIPFVGAWIELKDQPMSVSQEAYVAFAGPFIGTVGATVLLWLAGQYESRLMLAVAYAGFIINLFNLVPIAPFDGGRIVAILSPKVWLLGAPILLGIFLLIPSPMFLLILVLLAPTMWHALKSAWRGTAPEGIPRYYEVPREQRVRYAAYYLLLIAYLCVMAYRVHEQLRPPGPAA